MLQIQGRICLDHNLLVFLQWRSPPPYVYGHYSNRKATLPAETRSKTRWAKCILISTITIPQHTTHHTTHPPLPYHTITITITIPQHNTHTITITIPYLNHTSIHHTSPTPTHHTSTHHPHPHQHISIRKNGKSSSSTVSPELKVNH